MTGSLEEAVLDMCLRNLSRPKVEEIDTELTSTRTSKDVVDRIGGRFDDVFSEWRGRKFDKSRYPYLYLDVTFLEACWAGAWLDIALLVAVGVDDQGYREVLTVEGESPGAAWQQCVVHVERNVFAYVPPTDVEAVAVDSKVALEALTKRVSR